VFRGWPREDYDRERRNLRINVNGTEVLRTKLACYESSPSDLRIGRLAWPTGGIEPAFTGDVISVSRLPLVRPGRAVSEFKKAAPVKLELYLPSSRANSSDPILVTGQGTRSDLVYCSYGSDSRVTFGFDHYGNGGPRSAPVEFDPHVPHTLVIGMGSMAGSASADRLVIVFDGRVLLDRKQEFYPGSPESAVVGFNAYGSSVAGDEFTGRIVRVGQVGPAALPRPPLDSGEYGAVELSILLPTNVPGTAEPLVASGVAGAGDLVYVRYVDPRHIVVGFDHWGIGGSVSEPIAVDYGQAHHMAVSMDSLYPAGTAPRWTGIVRVTVDGEEALRAKWHCYPSGPDQITVARNAIGGSTCGALFTGHVLTIERFPEPRD
jgi:hypothetical protein